MLCAVIFLSYSGTYMFTWTTVAATGYFAPYDMYMNDGAIASSYCNSQSSSGAYSCSNTVVIHCESGSRVYIQCGPSQSCRFRNNDQNSSALQSFAGFLLAADD